MILNMVGGASIKLKVVGGMEAPSPKENLIWVKTDKEVTGFVISPVEPATAKEGMVWIASDSAGKAVMNLTKDDSVVLCLSQCKQCVPGAWKRMNAYIYQSEWKQFSTAWDGYYFNNGEQYEDVTGGWSGNGYTYSTSYTMYAGKVGNNLVAETSGAYTASMVGTVDAVDLTDVSTLYITVDAASIGYGAFKVLSTKDNGNMVKEVNFAEGEITLDVSDLVGAYYLCLCSAGGSTIPNTSFAASVVRGE